MPISTQIFILFYCIILFIGFCTIILSQRIDQIQIPQSTPCYAQVGWLIKDICIQECEVIQWDRERGDCISQCSWEKLQDLGEVFK